MYQNVSDLYIHYTVKFFHDENEAVVFIPPFFISFFDAQDHHGHHKSQLFPLTTRSLTQFFEYYDIGNRNRPIIVDGLEFLTPEEQEEILALLPPSIFLFYSSIFKYRRKSLICNIKNKACANHVETTHKTDSTPMFFYCSEQFGRLLTNGKTLVIGPFSWKLAFDVQHFFSSFAVQMFGLARNHFSCIVVLVKPFDGHFSTAFISNRRAILNLLLLTILGKKYAEKYIEWRIYRDTSKNRRIDSLQGQLQRTQSFGQSLTSFRSKSDDSFLRWGRRWVEKKILCRRTRLHALN